LLLGIKTIVSIRRDLDLGLKKFFESEVVIDKTA